MRDHELVERRWRVASLSFSLLCALGGKPSYESHVNPDVIGNGICYTALGRVEESELLDVSSDF